MSQDTVRVLRSTAPDQVAYWALGAFGVIAAAVTVIAIVESYSNLYAFAVAHGLAGWRAAIAPAAVDSFIVMGELLLFASILLAWDSALAFGLGAGMAAWGFGLSVAGNVWHASSASPVDRAVAAIWPVTATAGMAGALIIIKRLTSAARLPEPSPPVLPPESREPRTRKARDPELAATREAQIRELAAELARTAPPWPGEEKLGKSSGLGRRSAKRALELARTTSNGTSHDDGDRA